MVSAPFYRRYRRVLIVSGLLLTVGVMATALYLYLAWWTPNRKMADPGWWQRASPEEMRRVSHAVLSFPLGNHHDAFLVLAEIGNAASVPLLIRSLKWRPATDPEGFVICTSEHAVDALRSLTGEDFGFDPGAWERWWEASGAKLPAGRFFPRPQTRTRRHAGE